MNLPERQKMQTDEILNSNDLSKICEHLEDADYELPFREYDLKSDAYLKSGVTLRIKDGTCIFCNEGAGLIVDGGILIAEGTAYSRIKFKPNNKTWKNISFLGSGANKSILKYCNIVEGTGRKSYPGLDSHTVFGGGISIIDSSPTLKNCRIYNCNSQLGGGIYLNNSDAIIRDSVIEDNKCEFNGGGVYMDNASPKIGKSIVRYNSTKNNGGGIYINDSKTVKIKENYIGHNSTTGGGGGIYIWESKVVLKGNEITNNKCGGHSGGVFVYRSKVKKRKNLIKYNLKDNVYDYGKGKIRKW